MSKRAAAVLFLVVALLSACDGCDEGPGRTGDDDGGGSWFDVEAGVVDEQGDDAGGHARDDAGDADGDGIDGGAVVDDDDADGGADAGDGDAGDGTGGDDDAGGGGEDAADDGGVAGDDAGGHDDGGGTSGTDAGSGAVDAGFVDATGDDEVWIELDWSDAYSPQSPAWSFSATPGWGPAQWAMSGDTWPEAWDRWNNLEVVDDPIGRSVAIGSGGSMQLMLGLEELGGYDHAEVRLWGRSRATSSSVLFDVYNPLVDCGDSASTSQDWTVHVIDVDLGECMVPGEGVQAVRVEPTSGTLALVRMRVTLFGATW